MQGTRTRLLSISRQIHAGTASMVGLCSRSSGQGELRKVLIRKISTRQATAANGQTNGAHSGLKEVVIVGAVRPPCPISGPTLLRSLSPLRSLKIHRNELQSDLSMEPSRNSQHLNLELQLSKQQSRALGLSLPQ